MFMKVRKRATEVSQQLAQLQARLGANPAAMSFHSLLAEFAILSKQFTQLQAELRPQLRFYVAHPLELTNENRECAPLHMHYVAWLFGSKWLSLLHTCILWLHPNW
jgi:hypothetical protein